MGFQNISGLFSPYLALYPQAKVCTADVLFVYSYYTPRWPGVPMFGNVSVIIWLSDFWDL